MLLQTKKMKRMLAGLLCVLLMLSVYTPSAWAGDAIIDVNQKTSLTVLYQVGEDQAKKPVSGVAVRLYRVADVSPQLEFTLVGDFRNYDVEVNGLDSAGWRNLSETLSGYVLRDRVAPLRSTKSGEDGKAIFNDLKVGLYLVMADPYTVDGKTHVSQPFLVCLPNRDINGAWQYDVVAVPKEEILESGDRRVIKIWKDNGQEAKRPESITVQLLQNGEVFDTQTLSQENNWRYDWHDLDGESDWKVVEKTVPSGYTVTVEKQGLIFAMTNSIKPDNPNTPDNPPGNPPDEPKKPDEPSNPPDNPNTPDNPPDTDIFDTDVPRGHIELPPLEEIPGEPVPTAGFEQTLPQTGVLWWPVPVLAICGMLMFLFGWTKNQRYGER